MCDARQAGQADEDQWEANAEFHKLDMEDIQHNVMFAQHCGSIRPAFTIRCKGSSRLVVKCYPGMGLELFRTDTRSIVVICRSHECLGRLLRSCCELFWQEPDIKMRVACLDSAGPGLAGNEAFRQISEALSACPCDLYLLRAQDGAGGLQRVE